MKYIVSWSGGKDCSLALYKAQQLYGPPNLLLTSVPEKSNSVMAHGYREEVLKVQAQAMDIAIDFMYFSPNQYREAYLKKLRALKESHNITHVVYGDLYLNEHKIWIEAVCKEVALTALFPAWIKPAQSYDLFKEYLALGFKAIIVNVNKQFLDHSWLGKTINENFGNYAKGKFCPMAECGEYHSLVVDGPIFKKELQIEQYQEIEEDDCFKMNIEKIRIQ